MLSAWQPSRALELHVVRAVRWYSELALPRNGPSQVSAKRVGVGRVARARSTEHRFTEDPVNVVGGLRRWLFVALGIGFVALAAVGVVVPGIPTTPFLLVASYFLLRSSPRLHIRLLRSRTFGPVLHNWHANRALTRRVKRFSVGACTAMICLSILFGGLPWPARLLVAAVGAYGIYFVSRIPVVEGDFTS